MATANNKKKNWNEDLSFAKSAVKKGAVLCERGGLSVTFLTDFKMCCRRLDAVLDVLAILRKSLVRVIFMNFYTKGSIEWC